MAKHDEKKQQIESHEEVDLRGTLVSVSILGLFLLVTWLGVWYIFISR